MLLKDYSLEIFKSKCQADAKGVHCFAHLNQDVSKALPYLNAALGGFEYLKDPPSVTFKAQGKLITVHGNTIAVNALGEPTCMVFATKVAEGGRGADRCPQLSEEQKDKLDKYMEMFQFDI